MRWPSFLTLRPVPTSAPIDPLHVEISEAVARRREARLARPVPNEAKRFARARPKVDQLRHERMTQLVDF